MRYKIEMRMIEMGVDSEARQRGRQGTEKIRTLIGRKSMLEEIDDKR